MCISGIWLIVGIVSAYLCEDFIDLTSPTSNHTHLAISVAYDTLKNIVTLVCHIV